MIIFSADKFWQVKLTDHVLVDLVRYDHDVVLLGQVGHLLQLVSLVDLAERVVRVVEDEGFRLLAEERLQLVKVQPPVCGADDPLRLRLKCGEEIGDKWPEVNILLYHPTDTHRS